MIDGAWHAHNEVLDQDTPSDGPLLQRNDSTTDFLWSDFCLVHRNHRRRDANAETGNDSSDNEEGDTVGGCHQTGHVVSEPNIDNMRSRCSHGTDDPEDCRELNGKDTGVAISEEGRAQGADQRSKRHRAGDATLRYDAR